VKEIKEFIEEYIDVMLLMFVGFVLAGTLVGVSIALLSK